MGLLSKIFSFLSKSHCKLSSNASSWRCHCQRPETQHKGTNLYSKQDENLASHILKVGVLFIASWLKGEGVVEVDGSVEDSATAEISRSQVLLAVAPRNCLS